jgi:RNA polymerase sigma factor (sigma-70 family)
VFQDNANNARALMIQHNIRLVVKNARQFEGRGVDLQDLIVEGVVGLTRAVERFDAGRGFKFSTYAYWWIRQVLPACGQPAGHVSSHCNSFPFR